MVLYFYCLLHTFIMSSRRVGMLIMLLTPLHNTFMGWSVCSSSEIEAEGEGFIEMLLLIFETIDFLFKLIDFLTQKHHFTPTVI